MTILYIPIIPQWKGQDSSGGQRVEQWAVTPAKVGRPNNNHPVLENIKEKSAKKNDCPVGMGTERTICTMVRAGPI